MEDVDHGERPRELLEPRERVPDRRGCLDHPATHQGRPHAHADEGEGRGRPLDSLLDVIQDRRSRAEHAIRVAPGQLLVDIVDQLGVGGPVVGVAERDDALQARDPGRPQLLGGALPEVRLVEKLLRHDVDVQRLAGHLGQRHPLGLDARRDQLGRLCLLGGAAARSIGDQRVMQPDEAAPGVRRGREVAVGDGQGAPQHALERAVRRLVERQLLLEGQGRAVGRAPVHAAQERLPGGPHRGGQVTQALLPGPLEQDRLERVGAEDLLARDDLHGTALPAALERGDAGRDGPIAGLPLDRQHVIDERRRRRGPRPGRGSAAHGGVGGRGIPECQHQGAPPNRVIHPPLSALAGASR